MSRRRWDGQHTADALSHPQLLAQAMDYGFIKVMRQPGPSDASLDYNRQSEPGAVPK